MKIDSEISEMYTQLFTANDWVTVSTSKETFWAHQIMRLSNLTPALRIQFDEQYNKDCFVYWNKPSGGAYI